MPPELAFILDCSQEVQEVMWEWMVSPFLLSEILPLYAPALQEKVCEELRRLGVASEGFPDLEHYSIVQQ